eukprot:scaffold126272_cov63-Phaeocystis_antarctica.AAC.2
MDGTVSLLEDRQADLSGQQVANRLVIDLEVRHLERPLASRAPRLGVGPLRVGHGLQHLAHAEWDQAVAPRATADGRRLAARGLAVGKDGGMVALQRACNRVANGLGVDLLGGGLGSVHPIKVVRGAWREGAPTQP